MSSTIQIEDGRSGSILPYLCWVVILVLGFYNLVYLREVVLSILIVLGMGSKLLVLADKIGFFLFAVFGLLIILTTEPYLRNGWKQRRLAMRFWRLIAIGFGWLSITWSTLLGLPGLAEDARPSIERLAVAALLLVSAATLYCRSISPPPESPPQEEQG
ncbi:hypothetical protein MK139_07195 [bacterium]|nr:hypothetical protein [bacterium]